MKTKTTKKTVKKKDKFKGIAWRDEDHKALDNFVVQNISKANFSITLNIAGQVYKGEGDTPLAALQSIPKPGKISSKGIFVITDGVKKSREVLMLPLRLRRLFFNKVYQQIQLKSLCMGMK